MMRLSIRHDVDRERQLPSVNFDAYLFSQADVDKAMKALAVVKELLPPDLPSEPTIKSEVRK